MVQYSSFYVGEDVIPPSDTVRVAWVTRHVPTEFFLSVLQKIYRNVFVVHFDDKIFGSYIDFASYMRALNRNGFVPFPVAPEQMLLRAQKDDFSFGRFAVYSDNGETTLRYVDFFTAGEREILITGNTLGIISERARQIA